MFNRCRYSRAGAGSAVTAASADGDPTNEVRGVTQALCTDGDCTNEAQEVIRTFYRGDQAGTSIIKSYASRVGGYEHSRQVLANGNLNNLMKAHSNSSSTPPSPFVSVTTDPQVARFFAGPDDIVNKFQIPLSRVVQNTYNNFVVPAGTNGKFILENEWLVPHYIRLSEFGGVVQ